MYFKRFQNKVPDSGPVSPQKDVNEQQQQGVDVADVFPQRFFQQRVQFLVLVRWWNKTRTSGGQTTDPQRSSLPPWLWHVVVRIWAEVRADWCRGHLWRDEVHARLAAESGPPGEPVQLDPGADAQSSGPRTVRVQSVIYMINNDMFDGSVSIVSSLPLHYSTML